MTTQQKNEDACRLLRALQSHAEKTHRETMRQLTEIARLNTRINEILERGVFRHLTRAGDIVGAVETNFPIILSHTEEGSEHEVRARTTQGEREKRSHGNEKRANGTF